MEFGGVGVIVTEPFILFLCGLLSGFFLGGGGLGLFVCVINCDLLHFMDPY